MSVLYLWAGQIPAPSVVSVGNQYARSDESTQQALRLICVQTAEVHNVGITDLSVLKNVLSNHLLLLHNSKSRLSHIFRTSTQCGVYLRTQRVG